MIIQPFYEPVPLGFQCHCTCSGIKRPDIYDPNKTSLPGLAGNLEGNYLSDELSAHKCLIRQDTFRQTAGLIWSVFVHARGVIPRRTASNSSRAFILDPLA